MRQVHIAFVSAEHCDIAADLAAVTTGCGELADEIYRSRERKPSVAVIDGNCYSAAYYLGSAASRVMCTPSSGIGSIGTLAMHIDASKQLEQEGITVTLIHAGEAKVDGNPFQPLSDRAKERIEAAVQYHYGMFTDSVARFRGIPVEDVRATEAGCYTPPEALALGLIDGVGVSADAIMTIVGAGGGMSESISQDEVARISAQAAAQAVADEFSAAMESTGNPNVGPDNAGNTVGGSTADRVLANYGAVTGYAYRKTA
jgi:ClpP class serine protease